MRDVKQINDLSEIPHRDGLCITGGEPLEYPKLLSSVIDQAKTLGFQKLWLYTARFTPRFEEFVQKLDGIQFSLHENASPRDISDFERVQQIALRYPEKSFRAFMVHNLKSEVSIIPCAWKRIEIKPVFSESERCLPTHEEIYSLQCEYKE